MKKHNDGCIISRNSPILVEGSMIDKICDVIKTYWLKPVSTLGMFIVLGVAYAGVVSTVNDWEVVAIDGKILCWLAIPFLLAWCVYTVVCFVKNRLPSAPKDTVAVLFCIDAESDKLFETARYKLVNNFTSSITNVGGIRFKALCVSKARLARYDLQQKDDALAVLERTNCVLLVRVRYTADDVDNAENFELKIDYGVRHPAFNESATRMLSHDMSALNAPVGKQKFVKAETIDVFNFTTQTLVCACQYVLGVVALLAGDSQTALTLLLQSRNSVTTEFSHMSGIAELLGMIDDRIYAALCQLASEYLICFQNDKSIESLHEMCRALRLANAIHPDTYFYNLNMAYAYIILDQDAEAAKSCVAKCKLSRENTNWMYSEAFLSAYLNHAPGSILSKYGKALSNPYKSLSEIVEYIEFVIENEPDKVPLHLAAALVYEEMGDKKLMMHHFSVYMDNAKKLDRRTREKIEAKMNGVACGTQCDHNCSRCGSLIA